MRSEPAPYRAGGPPRTGLPSARTRAAALARACSGALAALLAVAPAALAGPAIGPPLETRTLTRTIDPVAIPGDRLSHFIWVEVARVGMFAFRAGRLDPIPFQIDEKDVDGLTLPTRMVQGTPSGKDEQPGKIDQTDELVFLSRDTGDRLPAEAKHAAASKRLEIEILDPIGQKKGWAYAFEFPPGVAVPRSGETYVRADPKRDFIRSTNYEVGFGREDIPTAYTHYSIPQSAGGNGKNLVDCFKADADITLFFGTLSVHRDLKDVSTTELGYREGPVRVIRRIASSIRLALNIQSPEIISDSYFYPDFLEFPGVVNLPFDAPSLIDDFKMVAVTDFSENAVGMTWVNSLNPEGVAIDGLTSEAEKGLDKRPYEWALAHGRQGAWMNMLVFHGDLARVDRNLAYLDDRDVVKKPENEPGSIGATGYDFEHLEKLSKGRHYFTSYIFSPSRYTPGDEQAFIDYVKNPLQAKVR